LIRDKKGNFVHVLFVRRVQGFKMGFPFSSQGMKNRHNLSLLLSLFYRLFEEKVGIGLPLLEEFSIGSQLSLRFGVL